jgi:hypothetical protein
LIIPPVALEIVPAQLICQFEAADARLVQRCDALWNELSTIRRGPPHDLDVVKHLEDRETENERFGMNSIA